MPLNSKFIIFSNISLSLLYDIGLVAQLGRASAF